MVRKDWNDKIFRTELEKNEAITKKICELHKVGQPILVFTSNSSSLTLFPSKIFN